jgi:DNA-binding transcriptional ArsR family regulator
MKKDDRLDAIFGALADTTRRRIIGRLARGPLAVGELAEPFVISLAAVSKHLDVLERAGLVLRKRDGRFQHCHLTARPLDDASAFIDHYRSFWDDTLDQLARYVEDGNPRDRRRVKKAEKP